MILIGITPAAWTLNLFVVKNTKAAKINHKVLKEKTFKNSIDKT